MKIVTLDRRHTGFPQWKYYAHIYTYKPLPERVRLFCDWREWCWTTWGPSKELGMYNHNDLFDGEHCSNSHWCWLSDEKNRRRIYLRTDQEASAFIFKWT